MRCQTDGFSFIEVLVVLALCVLLISIMAVNVSFLDHLLVRAEAEKLFLVCRALQQEAISCNEQKILSFDQAKQTYQYDTTVERLSRAVQFGTMPTVKGPPASPTRHLGEAVTFIGKKIVFSPDGIIQPGSVYLISKDKKSMYAVSSPVSQVSFLRLYRYDNTWHCLM